MKKFLTFICITGFALSAVAASDLPALEARLTAAKQVITEIMSTPDKGIPQEIVEKATCIAVVPSVKKAAFVVGAEYGQGVVTCRTKKGWSGPVFIRLGGGSFGFQIGGQATDLVLVAVNDRGFQALLKSKVKLGADASAAAGPVGRHAQAATDASMNAELLTYSRAKGLFAGIDLSGASISQNTDDTKTLYGGNSLGYDKILHGDVAVPAPAQPFVRTVAKYFTAARDSKAAEKK